MNQWIAPLAARNGKQRAADSPDKIEPSRQVIEDDAAARAFP